MMSLNTQLPEGHVERFTSPNLRLRDSTALWGPLQISIHRHRQSAELGYQAGEEAYQAIVRAQHQGNVSSDMLEHYMTCYLTTPRYRPRCLTEQIAAEWRAMFILGWTGQLLQDLAQRDTGNQNERHFYARNGCVY